jgi:hypothetical protein
MSDLRRWMKLIEGVGLLDGTLYHATPSRNVSGIRAHGLKPTATGSWGNTYQSPRVYLVQDNSDCESFAYELIRDHGVPEVSVIEVNVRGLDIEVHADPDWGGDEATPGSVVYTDAAIPASAIGRVVQTFTEDDFS